MCRRLVQYVHNTIPILLQRYRSIKTAEKKKKKKKKKSAWHLHMFARHSFL